MVDLETANDKPDSAILSIGAVMFDIDTGALGEEFYMTIDLQSCVDARLSVGIQTIMWWMRQGQEAFREAWKGENALKGALHAFASWWTKQGGNGHTPIWSHGATFDIPIIVNAYRATGITCPFDFRSGRDTRTMFSFTHAKIQNSGTKHHALHDAKSQAVAICDAFREINKWRSTWETLQNPVKITHALQPTQDGLVVLATVEPAETIVLPKAAEKVPQISLNYVPPATEEGF